VKKPWWRTAALPRLRSRLDFMLNMNPLSAATRANTAFGWRFSGVLICCATAQRKNACILADQLRVVIPQMGYLYIETNVFNRGPVDGELEKRGTHPYGAGPFQIRYSAHVGL
jgi:hypothetical protein